MEQSVVKKSLIKTLKDKVKLQYEIARICITQRLDIETKYGTDEEISHKVLLAEELC